MCTVVFQYITYVSPVLRAMLSSNFSEGQSRRVPITQTSAEHFVTFMRAHLSGSRAGDG